GCVVTRPRRVHPSVVKKSAPAIAPQWACRNVRHDVGRSGTGGIPSVLRIRAMVDRPTRCPTFLRAPRIGVYPPVGSSPAIRTPNRRISASTPERKDRPLAYVHLR